MPNINKITDRTNGVKILSDILEKYSASKNNTSTTEFITEALRESKEFNNDSDITETVAVISKTIDSISQGYREIQDYKKQGLSSAIWLRDNLEKSVSSLSQIDQDSVISSVKSAMSGSNSDLLKTLTNQDTAFDIVPKLITTNFADINRTAIANNLKEEIKASTLLGVINFDGNGLQIDSTHKEIQAAKKYFAQILDCDGDNDFKKVVTAGVEIAKRKHVLPELLANKTTAQIAEFVDNGVTTAKIAHKVATGDFQVGDATDYLIDRTVSRVGTVVKRTCENVGSNMGAAAGAAVGALLGPAGAAIGATIGRAVGYIAGKFVGETIVQGVKKIAHVAKELVRDCFNAVKNVVSSAWEGVRSIGSSVASFFGF